MNLLAFKFDCGPLQSSHTDYPHGDALEMCVCCCVVSLYFLHFAKIVVLLPSTPRFLHVHFQQAYSAVRLLRKEKNKCFSPKCKNIFLKYHTELQPLSVKRSCRRKRRLQCVHNGKDKNHQVLISWHNLMLVSNIKTEFREGSG